MTTLLVVTVALASGAGRPEDAYDHPLLTPDAQELIAGIRRAHPGISAQGIRSMIGVRTGVVQTSEESEAVNTSGVRLVERDYAPEGPEFSPDLQDL